MRVAMQRSGEVRMVKGDEGDVGCWLAASLVLFTCLWEAAAVEVLALWNLR